MMSVLPDFGPARQNAAFRRLLAGGLLSTLGSSMTYFATPPSARAASRRSLSWALLAQRSPEVVMELEVADHPEQERFEIHADGELAGFVDYRLHDGELALLHAETLSRFRHRGFAGRLVQFSLDSARERQLAVLPYCPFVRRWIADHAEYADVVPEDRRPYFGLLP